MNEQNKHDNEEIFTTPFISSQGNYDLPTPITCPRCHSRELAFVTEYHKAIGMRITFFLFLAIALFVFFATFQDKNAEGAIVLTIIFGLFAFITYICVLLEESKTHVQGICKDCGNLWLLN